MKTEKRLCSIILASTVLILSFILVSSTASAEEVSFIEGEISSGDYSWSESNFAGLQFSEDLAVYGISENVIPAGGIVYETSIGIADYEYQDADEGWTQYPVIGFFAKEYVPLKPTDASKLAELVLDSDDKYNIKNVETLNLGGGYALEAKQIDVGARAVWLEFSKNGEYVNDVIVSVADGAETIWEVELDDIQDEDDITVLKVHISDIFQEEGDDTVQIEGLWLIDYANAIEIEPEAQYGSLSCVSVIGDTITMTNPSPLTLTSDSDVEIAEGIFLKASETTDDVIEYYPYVEKIIYSVEVIEVQ